MKNTKLPTKIMAIGALLLTAFPAVADIKMGVFPRRPVAATFAAFQPLADHLSNQLGEKVELIVAKDFKSFWKGVVSGEYDLVHYNQYHYVRSHADHGYRVIVANEEQGQKTIAGALTVRADSGINNVEDIRGKTIVFGGGPKAMGSYIAPVAILKKSGLEKDKDYTVKFAKNPPSAVIAVFNKVEDVAGSGSIVLKIKSVTQKIDVAQMKTLALSEPFTHLAWAVRVDMDPSKEEKIRSIMTTLKQSDDGKKVLKQARVTDFYAVNDSDYDGVRKIVEYATGESL